MVLVGLSLVILLFLLLPLLPPFSYFSSFSSLSSGSNPPSDSLMHVFLALPRCLGSWAAWALFSVSHQFWVIRLVFLHFFASKMQAQKRGLTIFRPMFSSISGGGG